MLTVCRASDALSEWNFLKDVFHQKLSLTKFMPNIIHAKTSPEPQVRRAESVYIPVFYYVHSLFKKTEFCIPQTKLHPPHVTSTGAVRPTSSQRYKGPLQQASQTVFSSSAHINSTPVQNKLNQAKLPCPLDGANSTLARERAKARSIASL